MATVAENLWVGKFVVGLALPESNRQLASCCAAVGKQQVDFKGGWGGNGVIGIASVFFSDLPNMIVSQYCIRYNKGQISVEFKTNRPDRTEL